ncbi:MAG: 30S ribosomal protein S17 [Candidatus Diapherotrites archaeon]|nr:30S ribosomal protein S17 [Candidatus Diapherotrites archaeon]
MTSPQNVACTDSKCAVHGHLKVRGNVFVGRIVSAKAARTAVIERTQTIYIPKYERYKKVRVRQAVHNPECMNAKENDIVRVGETRKISKTKAFAVLEVLGSAKEIEREDEVRHRRERAKESMRQSQKDAEMQKAGDHT